MSKPRRLNRIRGEDSKETRASEDRHVCVEAKCDLLGTS